MNRGGKATRYLPPDPPANWALFSWEICDYTPSMPTLCIHGHCYQPPRLDPWLEEVLPEGSAAPYLNWNERITAECYGPLAHARRLNGQGEIKEIVNCFEWISFNFGPTLLDWMQRHSSTLYRRILDADRRSIERLGHGNALAQCYHHSILPFASELDRDLEVRWAVQDFEHRFGRSPEGMWLPETAVDTPTLESLARAGIGFTILAPRQAEAVADLEGRNWQEVDESSLDSSEPYLVRLPSGLSIAVFFYDGPVSRAVAFERLLADGEGFWRRLTANPSGLQCIATDGESYGHHFKFGEMALSYVIEQARAGRESWELSNFAAYLAHSPPRRQVRIRERSSWSCAHGIGRWTEDCGCSDGGHHGWNQKWRTPLRHALDLLRVSVDEQFRREGKGCFHDPEKAVFEFGRVLSGQLSREEYGATALRPRLSIGQKDIAFSLLAMKRWALAAYSSCAWFFDDIGRIEPLNGLTFALRSMELLKATKGPDIAPRFTAILVQAVSNEPGKGNGADLWQGTVLPRQPSPEELVCFSLALSQAQGVQTRHCTWPGVDVRIQIEPDGVDRYAGRAVLDHPLWSGTRLSFEFFPVEPDLLRSTLIFPGSRAMSPKDLEPRKKRMLAFELTRRRTEDLWQSMVEDAAACAPLFLPFEEGQTEPTGCFHPFALGLGWLWITGDLQDSPDLQEFLSRTARRDQAFTRQISRSVTLSLLSLLDRSSVEWDRVARMISRSRFLGFEPERWEVQNRIWELGREALSTEAARLINFARPE
jgi:hypothetical protein